MSSRYVYRGDGKRAWKQLAGGARTYFYYMGDKLTATSDGNAQSSLQLWGADGLVGARNNNAGTVSKFYFLYDTQGNLAQTLNAANGAVVSQSAVSAWGEPLRDNAGNATSGGYGAKFGYIRDGESGFYLCTLRYYDPSVGRWITRDPIGYDGGSNLYGYVGNDPVNMSDPMGLNPIAKILVGDYTIAMPDNPDAATRFNWWVMQSRISNATRSRVNDIRSRFENNGYEVHIDWEASMSNWKSTVENDEIKAIAFIGHSGTYKGNFMLLTVNGQGQAAIGPTASMIRSWRKGRKLDKVLLYSCSSARLREAFGFYGARKKFFRAPTKAWSPLSEGEVP